MNALTRRLVTRMSSGPGATSGWISLAWAEAGAPASLPNILLRGLISGAPGRNPTVT